MQGRRWRGRLASRRGGGGYFRRWCRFFGWLLRSSRYCSLCPGLCDTICLFLQLPPSHLDPCIFLLNLLEEVARLPRPISQVSAKLGRVIRNATYKNGRSRSIRSL